MVEASPPSSAPRSLFPPSLVQSPEEGKKKGILDDILLMCNQDDCNSYKHPMVALTPMWSIHLEAAYLI
ncbi:hypothetical protein C4D60_Mb07t04030 [Musa balbisiana]|uniref:Uncharacterized protein n=1 Tax=Musa balbisiana TaxID=52838 RepID=A0A4S8JCS8_MUSBA|nr:hypothetical protein C4D60_Mb07t04030 [Musa balbisiana]